MNDLGINKALGNDPIGVISKAVELGKSNEFFNAAFASPQSITDSSPEKKKGISIGVAEISTRNALMYLSILMKAVQAVGYGSFPSGKIHVERWRDGTPELVIYSSNKPRSWVSDVREHEETEDDLLLEPDLSNEEERENPKYEISSGGVPGPAMPLGTVSKPPKENKK